MAKKGDKRPASKNPPTPPKKKLKLYYSMRYAVRKYMEN